MHKYTYLVMYVLVNIWTVSIHDGDFRVPMVIRPIINGSAHHTDHHVSTLNVIQGSHWDWRTWKMGRHFPVRESQGILNRLEKSGKITRNTRKVREFQTNVIYYF